MASNKRKKSPEAPAKNTCTTEHLGGKTNGPSVRHAFETHYVAAKEACDVFDAVDVQTAHGMREVAEAIAEDMQGDWQVVKSNAKVPGYPRQVAIECEGVQIGIYAKKGAGVKAQIIAIGSVADQFVGKTFAKDGMWGQVIAARQAVLDARAEAKAKPKASAKTRKATSKAKADAVAEVAKDAPAVSMDDLREFKALFPDASFAEAREFFGA